MIDHALDRPYHNVMQGIEAVEEPLCKGGVLSLPAAVENRHAKVSGNEHQQHSPCLHQKGYRRHLAETQQVQAAVESGNAHIRDMPCPGLFAEDMQEQYHDYTEQHPVRLNKYGRSADKYDKCDPLPKPESALPCDYCQQS